MTEPNHCNECGEPYDCSVGDCEGLCQDCWEKLCADKWWSVVSGTEKQVPDK